MIHDILGRAAQTLERELQGGASLIQLQRADGDPKVTSDELAVDEDAKVSLHQTCMLRA